MQQSPCDLRNIWGLILGSAMHHLMGAGSSRLPMKACGTVGDQHPEGQVHGASSHHSQELGLIELWLLLFVLFSSPRLCC